MARDPSPDIDDELFNEVYGKAYTGPVGSNAANNSVPKGNDNKRAFPGGQSDEEDEPRDPNAVPTDFTSREAKVWEAKAKATERNWKKRKEEEMICKICGELGHFTQGCPSTLGANRKNADFFERVPARDKQVRALFSPKVISQIEKDIGCKIKMDEKFLIVSGKDRLILAKGVDAVHKIIQEDKRKSRSPSSSNRTRSRSPDGSPRGSHFRRSESQRSSYSSPRDTSLVQNRGFNQERRVEDRVRENMHKYARDSPQAYANDGAKGRSARPKSPPRSSFGGDAYRQYDGYDRNSRSHRSNSLDTERHRAESRSERKFDLPTYQRSLEELEMEFKSEALELARIRDQEEDEENNKHREFIRELKENYTKKLGVIRSMHSKQWEEFLRLDTIQRQQHQALQTAYTRPAYPDYDQRNMQYVGNTGLSMDTRNRYPYPNENYSAPRPHDAYSDYQNQRHEDYGKTYGQY
ncbi:hypothetical protein ACMD2_09930 [Ananas comosus]|uniref:CCHC-type domain-containing protein n=1 Tax=Ananas comosus TaxID=4615 RepID=A0A199V1V2_ANACO|nr:hypothetical protein ACMD2_09930 [Ananas comosus]